MNWKQALRQRLLDDAAVAAIADTRIDWRVRPQGSSLPAVVLRIIGDSRPRTMGGFQQIRESRVRATFYARDDVALDDLVEAVIVAATPPGNFSGVRFEQGFVDQAFDDPETTETGFVPRSLIELLIWHE